MKFAFSTLSCPQWDFDTVIARAKEYGFDGVELHAFLNESGRTAADPFNVDQTELREKFKAGGVQIVCLSSSLVSTGKAGKDAKVAADVKRLIDTAGAIGCPMVKILDRAAPSGRNASEAASALAGWLSPLADYAGEKGVILLVENALGFRTAKGLWTVLEMANNPSLAAAWDVCTAALAGEAPGISVPVLNTRIQYVLVRDAVLGPGAPALCKIGEGQVHLQDLLHRLMGIGYAGWVGIKWEKALQPELAEPEDVLPDAVKALREWGSPPAKPEPKKKSEVPAAGAVAAKPAAAAAKAAAPVETVAAAK